MHTAIVLFEIPHSREDNRVLRIVLLLLIVATGSQAQPRTVLAIGAHAGDVEITTGAVLARHARTGDRIVILHLTVGEGGNPKLPRDAYGAQKRREAVEAAEVLGAEVIFGPYKDAEIPRGDEPARYVAGVIAKVKPAWVITHWKNSIHRDHSLTHTIVTDAVLLAAVGGTRGIRGVYYADNWEDADAFQPYLYVDTTADLERWKKAATRYEFIRGGVSSFPYLDYYEALARMRGAQAGKKYAVAFDVDPLSRKRVLDTLP
jgi:N-acetylglucosamine malate deacetylase 1